MVVDYGLPPSSEMLNPPALIAKANVKIRDWGNVKLSDEPGFKKVITSCLDVRGYVDISRAQDALVYLGYQENPTTRAWTPSIDIDNDIKYSILEQPTHGRVGAGLLDGDFETYGYRITPRNPDNTPAYFGPDRVIFGVTIKGQTFKVIFNLLSIPDAETPNGQICETRRFALKDLPSGSSSAWLASAQLSSVLAGMARIGLSFADLNGAAVGNTVGEGSTASITLDTTAAGHGWYIDPTPLENADDYLPTSNPDVWQTKGGAHAAGKMDMLNVFLHEYGHALGLEHSADSGDFMAATLQAGERRLPSADELTLMIQLVAQLKASIAVADGSIPSDPTSPTVPNPSLPLGALLMGRMALGRKPEDAEQGSQALFSANATLPGWATQGTVVASPINGNANAGATLSESASAQTRLNQVFMVGPKDRYLSFTLSGIALDDAVTGPDDALEVALLDANSGASLVGPIGMTHTDPLLNLQANGAELAASGVTHVTNQDGSRTYLVDLTGVAFAASGGTAVNLSFDLIGFGSTASNLGSRATVSRVRLLAQKPVPQTLDDSI